MSGVSYSVVWDFLGGYSIERLPRGREGGVTMKRSILGSKEV